jgi:hypothetical protein
MIDRGSLRIGGDALSIVHVLRSYQKPLPSGFVASVLGKNEEELAAPILELSNRAIIKVDGNLLELMDLDT